MRSRYASKSTIASIAAMPFVFWLIWLAIVATVSGFAVEYIVKSLIGHGVPFFVAILVGLFTGGTAVPAAVILWLLHFTSITFPLVRGH